jgi:glycosyltransferase involved in cell wall biosynthesis
MLSIILPSYLKSYPNSASQPEAKLKRAIESVLNQTFKDFELIVVSDGCEKTVEIASQYELNLFKIDHQGGWGGPARNAGIKQAKNRWIIYLDSDDCFGKQHLEKIADGMCCSYDWFYFDDWIKIGNNWIERPCNTRAKGQCGTSNIVHKRTLPVSWGKDYLHDWKVITELWKYSHKRIDLAEYFVCHVPNKLDI